MRRNLSMPALAQDEQVFPQRGSRGGRKQADNARRIVSSLSTNHFRNIEVRKTHSVPNELDAAEGPGSPRAALVTTNVGSNTQAVYGFVCAMLATASLGESST